MYLVSILRDYNIYLSVILLVLGIFFTSYILARIYKKPKELGVVDIFLVVLSASLLSGGLFLQLILLGII